uniref:CSON012183 protein n=1 Tax=Culicoides sonorensis TaxID=179676 RepID=A0A336K182_CULSO
MTKLLKFIFIGLFFIINKHGVEGYLNLYLNQLEVMRLLGLSAELYYVRDGQVNEYALQFQVPVPANVRDISFTWLSKAGKPLPYRIHIITSDPEVLPRPQMNISRTGEVPTEVETFAIALRCSGIRAAEVDLSITIEITLNRATSNVTELVFRRKKICLKGENENLGLNDPLQQETVASPPSGLITLVIGGILAILLIDPFEMEHYLRDGFRLAQPVNCPDELFAIMAYCWALLPQERPTFCQLQIFLQDFYSQITRYFIMIKIKIH